MGWNEGECVGLLVVASANTRRPSSSSNAIARAKVRVLLLAPSATGAVPLLLAAMPAAKASIASTPSECFVLPVLISPLILLLLMLLLLLRLSSRYRTTNSTRHSRALLDSIIMLYCAHNLCVLVAFFSVLIASEVIGNAILMQSDCKPNGKQLCLCPVCGVLLFGSSYPWESSYSRFILRSGFG